MEFLFLIVIVVLAVVAYRMYQSSKSKAATQEAPPKKVPVDPLAGWNSAGGDSQFYALKPGDLVKQEGGDFLIRGTIQMEEGGSRWAEHLLDDAAGSKRWLSVEDDEGLELALWERVPLADVESGEPGERAVVIRGVAYKLIEKGNATFTSVGSTGTTESGSAEYVDYEAANGLLLGFERYNDGPWEVSLGKKALPSHFDIYPAEQGA